MNNYFNKYLKYKKKYFNLKNQLGSGGESHCIDVSNNKLKNLCIKCKHEVDIKKINNFNGEQFCPNCAYGIDVLKETKTNFAPKECRDIKKYFKLFNIKILLNEQNIKNLITYEINMNDNSKIEIDTTNPTIVNEISNIYSLNPNNYKNILSTKLVLDKYHLLSKEVNNISTICLEGNLIKVNNNSIVSSGAITSCIFAIILLNSGDKICFHSMLGHIDNSIYIQAYRSYINYHNILFNNKVDNNSSNNLSYLIDSIKHHIKKIFLFPENNQYDIHYKTTNKSYIETIFKNIPNSKIYKFYGNTGGNGLHIFTRFNKILFLSDNKKI